MEPIPQGQDPCGLGTEPTDWRPVPPVLTMITSSWGAKVMLNVFSRLFCISKFPNEVSLESENDFQVIKQK